MISIDHSDGLRWAFGTRVFKKTCILMVCDFPLLRSIPSWGEVLHENQSSVHFDPRLLSPWVLMNIINGIARGGSPCALVPPSLLPEEWTPWERKTIKRGMRWMYTNVYCWGNNSGLKLMNMRFPLINAHGGMNDTSLAKHHTNPKK